MLIYIRKTLGGLVCNERHRARSDAPALLVLAGGFALRWILVNAGQYSSVLQVAGF